MKKNILEIENIFTDLPQYNCYVCSPFHNNGLNLKFYYDKDEKVVFSPIIFHEENAGFPNVVHGGFQSMVLDEIMFWAAYYFQKKITVTANMNISFLSPVPTGIEFFAKSRILKASKRIYKIESWIELDQKVLSKAEGTFIKPTLEDFRKGLGVDRLDEKFELLL